MRRVKGYWHVRVMGIWFPAGETISEAFAYAGRMFEAIEAN
jgi:hypothetical protein